MYNKHECGFVNYDMLSLERSMSQSSDIPVAKHMLVFFLSIVSYLDSIYICPVSNNRFDSRSFIPNGLRGCEKSGVCCVI